VTSAKSGIPPLREIFFFFFWKSLKSPAFLLNVKNILLQSGQRSIPLSRTGVKMFFRCLLSGTLYWFQTFRFLFETAKTAQVQSQQQSLFLCRRRLDDSSTWFDERQNRNIAGETVRLVYFFVGGGKQQEKHFLKVLKFSNLCSVPIARDRRRIGF